MTVPEEVQAMHLRHFDAYISALVVRLTQTEEHYNFMTLCERIERLLSIGTEFYEDREEPSVVETTPIISPPAEQPYEETDGIPDRNLDEVRRSELHESGNSEAAQPAERAAGPVLPPSREYEDENPEGHGDGPGEEGRVDAEADVKATPTMSAEELRAWEAAQTTPQPERKRPVWSQAARDRAAERARNRNKKLVLEEAPALASTAPSLPEQAPTPRDESPAGDLTPEAAAHEDAAIILAELEPDPLPTRETLAIGNRPDCACPDGWLKPRESWMATDRALTHRHHVDCPLHRHKHRFPVAPDGNGNLIGECECGDTETRQPYSANGGLAVRK